MYSPWPAVDRHKRHLLHLLRERFANTELARSLEGRKDWGLALEAYMLESEYGPRLFELFDLTQPDLWRAYRRFAREYLQAIERKKAPGVPPRWEVC